MLLTPEYIFRAIEAITPEFLRQHGITALVLDVDNTLTGDGSQQLDATVQQWLDTMRAAGVRLTIVSNNTAARVRPFADRVGLAWVPLACKPLPVGLAVARRRLGVRKNQMAMVGDQIFTALPRGCTASPACIPCRVGATTSAVCSSSAGLNPTGWTGITKKGAACMSEAPRFGTAGLSDSYRVRSFDPQAMAEYTASFGLTAFEYQCGRGVRLGLDKAAALKEAFDAKGITFSVHAPYYISMSSLEEDKRLNSVNYLLQSCALVKALGGRRVIFHAGSCGKQSREAALEKALDTMRRAVQAVDEAGYGDCILCPETMGKVNQLGTLDEVLALCSVDERMIPCVDFGHLYARSQGTELNDETAPADYAAILDAIAAALPGERAKKFHAHFSRVAYTKGGEKCHLTFADTEFGPPPAPLMQLLKTRGLAPTIICESAGTQAEDAAALKKLYEQG